MKSNTFFVIKSTKLQEIKSYCYISRLRQAFSIEDLIIFCFQTETLDFNFLLKPKHGNSTFIVEKGPNRQFIGGTIQGDERSAMFKLSEDEVLSIEYLLT